MNTAIKKLQKENYLLTQILNNGETNNNSDSSQENLTYNTDLTYRCPSGSTCEANFIEPQPSISCEGSMEGVQFSSDNENIGDNEEPLIFYNSNTEERYCRLCFNLVHMDAMVPLDNPTDTSSSGCKYSEYESESDEVTNIIHMCLPFYEALIADPVICNRCVVNLKKYNDFRMRCLKNQELIENYIKINGTNNQPYDLSKIMKFKEIGITEFEKQFLISEGYAEETEETSDDFFLARSNSISQLLQIQNNLGMNEFIGINPMSFSQLLETSSSDCIVNKQNICTEEHNKFDYENFGSMKIEPKQEKQLTDEIDYPQDIENITVDTDIDTAKDIKVESTEETIQELPTNF